MYDTGKVPQDDWRSSALFRREDNRHHEGVAMILRKGMEKSLLEWKPVSSRLLSARLRGGHTNITLIHCYAPANDREDIDNDAFY